MELHWRNWSKENKEQLVLHFDEESQNSITTGSTENQIDATFDLKEFRNKN